MGGVINNRCYGKFKDAVKAARNEDTVHFGGDVIVKEPVYFGSNVKFQGEMCAGNRASLIAKFDSKKQAMLQATKSGQIVEFRDLDFTSQGINKAAAFHAGGEESDAGTQTIDAKFYNVHIHDMQSEALGVGIRVGNVLNLLIDADCKFQNLVQSSSEPDRFAGGSAVAVIYLPESSKMSISGMFIDNKSFYPGLGSNHAGGGAIYLDYLAGTVNIDAEFTGNESNEGGALKIQGVLGSTKISGLFKGNKGVDSGNGSRGGAIRVNKIFGTGVLEMDAHCMKNTTPGRGGVIASNVHNTGGKMTIKGLFQDNAAGTDGGVWSMWSTGTEFTAETIFEANSIINDNLAINDMRSSLYDVRDSMRHTRMSDRNWKIDQTVIVL
ncbi:hypothetical protein SARC_07073 [Sphaeroforma arctica JP610]|uniref:Right handed beta helix domain-containing protein n=1 Tax=Sphaeroforma arctica JP610 TaxID=667725 RepID=A0A0L0FVD1_9EUKA|nr:hypothetical protein SARC_07073 [Sphaeroforma arctica JP610]KNC80574.1 hypothetical protein SARC_07073 [Sphaeroforma arctica JP610]|eukprot:XP_014154476.1 hypothetical protein SARC_07073 [Sphaeroforma arctica JP610]